MSASKICIRKLACIRKIDRIDLPLSVATLYTNPAVVPRRMRGVALRRKPALWGGFGGLDVGAAFVETLRTPERATREAADLSIGMEVGAVGGDKGN